MQCNNVIAGYLLPILALHVNAYSEKEREKEVIEKEFAIAVTVITVP